MQLADTHCHLNFDAFKDDIDVVLGRARAAGVDRMLCPAVDVATSVDILSMVNRYSEIFAAVGVHPNHALSWQTDSLERLKTFAADSKVVAIGEIGLDYYWDKTPKELQWMVFEQQLKLASDLNLPVIIHNREADEDVTNILVQWQHHLIESASPLADLPGVLHSFSGTLEMAQRVLECGFYLGFTGPVTFQKADKLRTLVREVPLNRLLIETDAPFLTPHPFRGKRNEPSYVKLIADKIAETYDLSIDHIAQQTYQNSSKLFNW